MQFFLQFFNTLIPNLYCMVVHVTFRAIDPLTGVLRNVDLDDTTLHHNSSILIYTCPRNWKSILEQPVYFWRLQFVTNKNVIWLLSVICSFFRFEYIIDYISYLLHTCWNHLNSRIIMFRRNIICLGEISTSWKRSKLSSSVILLSEWTKQNFILNMENMKGGLD